ncbi:MULTISPECIES: ThiF family adenylyltransferase [unclassified Halobacteriovorax]|uniref:ThiF family adenylyltransferase n=1 Tax=unclassified Halobacteriovorax TaxID=2639665 RepID=UPI0039998E15
MLGFEQGLEELTRLEKDLGGLISIENSKEGEGFVTVEIGLDTSELNGECSNGYRIRAREEFLVYIPSGYPYKTPWVRSVHKNFNSLPHVQWGNQICLYLAPRIEWNIEQGMAGFINRLWSWLKKANDNSFNDSSDALHPPANINSAKSTKMIHVDSSTPKVLDDNWIGVTKIKTYTHNVFRVTDFIQGVENLNKLASQETYIPTILFNKDFPYDYPTNGKEFIENVLSSEESIEMLNCINSTLPQMSEGLPFFICLGTPMRRRSDNDSTEYHLTFWEVSCDFSKLKEFEGSSQIKNVKEKLTSLLGGREIKWACVTEGRDELVNYRDSSTLSKNIGALRKAVLLGAGAVGSHVAHTLGRCGVSKIDVIDSGIVTIPILCRQLYRPDDVGGYKSQKILNSLNKEYSVNGTAYSTDFQNIESEYNNLFDEADLFIESTGSNIVYDFIENKKDDVSAKHNFSVSIDGYAKNAIIVGWHKESTVGPKYLYECLKNKLLNEPSAKSIVNSFWPDKNEFEKMLFQPEPGCSEPTFRAGEMEVSTISNEALKFIAQLKSQLSETTNVLAYIERSDAGTKLKYFLSENPSVILDKNHDYKIVLPENVRVQLENHIEFGNKVRGEDIENGGLLYGRIIRHLNTIWIERATSAPKDSTYSKTEFICGIAGVEEYSKKLLYKYNSSVQYLGTWHTHPNSISKASTKDIEAAKKFLEEDSNEFLMFIIGFVPKLNVGSYLFLDGDKYE